MTHASRRNRIGVLLALGATAALAFPGGGAGQSGGGAAGPQPELGVADAQTVLMGATPAGESFGYRQLPLDTPAPVVDGRQLQFAQPADPRSPDRQLAFLSHTAARAWRVVDVPVDQNGRPMRGGIPNAASARITRNGGGLLVLRDPRRPAAEQAVVLLRDPSGRFRALPRPDPTVLLPGEDIAADRGTGRVPTAAFDTPRGTGAFFAAVGQSAEQAVIAYDGDDWSREPIDIPDFQPGDEFQVAAIGASGEDNAWLLGRIDDRQGRGIALFERVVSGGTATWVERPLGEPVFSDAATPARGVSDVAALSGGAQPLTVTTDGVWIDGGGQAGGDPFDFTLFYDPGAGDVTGSWCDARDGGGGALCASPLGARFSRREGYRSFAWPGAGFGTRIVTNPLRPDGGDETNGGTYLRLSGSRFERRLGGGGNRRPSGAFRNADEGWLEGPVRIGAGRAPERLRSWPVSLRAPLASIVHEPGKATGAIGSKALAVGPDGAIARFEPGSGWRREFLLTSSGTVSRATLRGVAWPSPSRAHAVGDLGSMWEWRADTGLWEKDPATPIGYEGNLMDVAFQPGDPERGYAVGKGGQLLRYDKTWTQETLPSSARSADLTQVAFAGRQALVAAGGELLVNDGGGWRADQGVKRLLDTIRIGSPRLLSVGGLPDGGAVVGGTNFVLQRDGGPGSAWRFAEQPLIGSTVIAAAPFRSGGKVRSVVSVVTGAQYPPPDILPPTDPNVPPPIVPPYPLPGDGYVLRQMGDGGWRDEQRTAFLPSGIDRPLKSDPILDFDLDARGEGWAAGGWSGEVDSAGRGTSARTPQARNDRLRVQTSGVYRYAQGTPAGPPSEGAADIATPEGPVRFAVGGHAQCENPCADLAAQGIAPDRTPVAAMQKVGALARKAGGPRFFLYTGGRTRPGADVAQPRREADRFAEVLSTGASVPVFAAPSAGDTGGGTAESFSQAFARFSAPFGHPAGARTHYAFDTTAGGRMLRVIVIDNSRGSLAASDPHQVPSEPQLPWLQRELSQARARGVPSVVMGSRGLNTRFRPRLNVASDGDVVARTLVAGGASAYFFERPEENRVLRIPAGAPTTIPEFGTGTLGYRSPLASVVGQDAPDSLFGDTGFLLVEADLARRDAATNRVPVSARLIPIVDDLSLQPLDGLLLRRSRVALFQGLGRRPRSGDRWGPPAGSEGEPSPPGGDTYVSFPPDLCQIPGCDTRLAPEYEFTSSAPDIGDFVKQDPQSPNPRKPLLGANDKPVSDRSSGLFCAYNAGTTTVTVKAGGLSYSQKVTVQAGSVQRPCGTRPLDPSRIPARPPAPVPTAPPANPPPGGDPPVDVNAPPPPNPPVAPAPVAPAPIVPPRPEPRTRPDTPSPPPEPPSFPESSLPPRPTDSGTRVPGTPPPTAPTPPRPIPPGGSVARVYQVEERKEEELATEESRAYARYSPDDGASPGRYFVGLALLAAFAGAAIAGAPRWRGSRHRPAAAEARDHVPTYQTYDRRKPR